MREYANVQGMWRTNGQREADYTDVLELDLATVEPSLAGPKRPQDRVPLRMSQESYRKNLAKMVEERTAKDAATSGKASVSSGGAKFDLADGAVLIAAITSCTNTSNPPCSSRPEVSRANARRRGVTSKPWVKTSLAPARAWSPTTSRRPDCSRISRALVFTWSATGARPASVIPGRCVRDLGGRSRR